MVHPGFWAGEAPSRTSSAPRSEETRDLIRPLVAGVCSSGGVKVATLYGHIEVEPDFHLEEVLLVIFDDENVVERAKFETKLDEFQKNRASENGAEAQRDMSVRVMSENIDFASGTPGLCLWNTRIPFE